MTDISVTTTRSPSIRDCDCRDQLAAEAIDHALDIRSVARSDPRYNDENFSSYYHRVARGLGATLRSLIEMSLKARSLSETEKLAIAILNRADSSLDDREWAERYLCGMTGPDGSPFDRYRRVQS